VSTAEDWQEPLPTIADLQAAWDAAPVPFGQAQQTEVWVIDLPEMPEPWRRVSPADKAMAEAVKLKPRDLPLHMENRLRDLLRDNMDRDPGEWLVDEDEDCREWLLALQKAEQLSEAEELDRLIRERQAQLHIEREARRRLDAAEAAADGMAPPEGVSRSLAEFLAGGSENEQIPCVIPGLLPQQCRLWLTGEEGRGKSTLVRWLGGCHAAGIHPFTGEPYDGGVTQLLDAENPEELLRMRLRELAAFLDRRMPGAAERMADRLKVECQPAGIDLSSPAWAGYLERTVAKHEPDLVCGGPVYKLSSQPARSEEAFTDISGVLGRLQGLHGFSLVMESHCRQPDKDGDRPEWPYGNTGWRRWPDMGYFLDSSGHLADWRGNRYGTALAWPVQVLRVAGSEVAWQPVWAPQGAGSDPAADRAAKIEEVAAVVAAEPGINQKHLRAKVGGAGNQWITAALEARAIMSVPGGRGKATRYYPPDESDSFWAS
jgi:AAA domain